MGQFIGAAQSLAAPTNVARTKGCSPLVPPRVTKKKGLGGLGHLPKIALLRGEGFDLKSFGEEVVEGKKILFHTFFKF